MVGLSPLRPDGTPITSHKLDGVGIEDIADIELLLEDESEIGVVDETLIEVDDRAGFDVEDATEFSTEDETMLDDKDETTLGVGRAAGVELGTTAHAGS